jgi:hypothetical protein
MGGKNNDRKGRRHHAASANGWDIISHIWISSSRGVGPFGMAWKFMNSGQRSELSENPVKNQGSHEVVLNRETARGVE